MSACYNQDGGGDPSRDGPYGGYRTGTAAYGGYHAYHPAAASSPAGCHPQNGDYYNTGHHQSGLSAGSQRLCHPPLGPPTRDGASPGMRGSRSPNTADRAVNYSMQAAQNFNNNNTKRPPQTSNTAPKSESTPAEAVRPASPAPLSSPRKDPGTKELKAEDSDREGDGDTGAAHSDGNNTLGSPGGSSHSEEPQSPSEDSSSNQPHIYPWMKRMHIGHGEWTSYSNYVIFSCLFAHPFSGESVQNAPDSDRSYFKSLRQNVLLVAPPGEWTRSHKFCRSHKLRNNSPTFPPFMTARFDFNHLSTISSLFLQSLLALVRPRPHTPWVIYSLQPKQIVNFAP